MTFLHIIFPQKRSGAIRMLREVEHN